MSETSATTPLPPGVEAQDDEHINWGRIGLLAGLALLLFAAGVVFMLVILKGTQGSYSQAGFATAPILKGCDKNPDACAQVGIVEQRQIPLEQRAVEMRKNAQRRLVTYGWTDEQHRLVHIPIEEGMKKLVGGERP